jgi:hypothetical protein
MNLGILYGLFRYGLLKKFITATANAGGYSIAACDIRMQATSERLK